MNNPALGKDQLQSFIEQELSLLLGIDLLVVRNTANLRLLNGYNSFIVGRLIETVEDNTEAELFVDEMDDSSFNSVEAITKVFKIGNND